MNKAIMIAFTLAIAVCLIGLEASLLSSKDDREPVCSKYHFEEKVLEQLVRMEHSNAIMMEEFNGIKDKLSTDLASMKKETEDMKIVHEQLDKLKINTEDLTTALQREITDFRKEINVQSKTTSYAFSDYWLADKELSTGEVPVFQKTIFDEAQTYDNSSGKYTVMRNGVYLFTARFCLSSRQYIEAKIVADGDRFGSFDAGDDGYNTCLSGTVVGKLNKGMEVWMVVTNSATCVNQETPYGFNYFAGLLIS